MPKDKSIRKVLVIGSGLSDGGILNFAKNDLLFRNTDEIIKGMEDAGALSRNLSGVQITWYGIGQVTSPQDNLNDKDLEAIKEIYRSVLENKGAKISFDDSIRSSGTIENNRHTVAITKVSDGIGPFIFDDKVLPFKGSSAEFNNEKAAEKTLEQVVEAANKYSRKTVVITGYMAPDSCDGNADTSLAEARANRVKNYLKSKIKNNIEVVNGGVYQPEVSVCDSRNKRIPEREQEKRRVVIKFE